MKKKRKITHYDKSGKVFEDLSKVEIPIELQKIIFEILNPNKKII